MASRRVSSRMLFSFSRLNTRSMTFSAFAFGSLPHAAHSRNLVGEFVVAHRVGRAALAEIGAAADVPAVGQFDVDDGGHFLVAGGFRFRMHAELDLSRSCFCTSARLTTSSVNSREAGAALEQQDRHAELHAELGLQLVFRAMVDQRVGHVAVGADPDLARPAPGGCRAARMRSSISAHAGVRERAAGMRLDRHAGERRRSTGLPSLPSIAAAS